MTLNNHHLERKMLTTAFMACAKVFGKYLGFCGTYTGAFEDFLGTRSIIKCKTDTSVNKPSNT